MSEKCEHGFKPPCPENYPFTGPHADECTGAENGQHVYAESVCGNCGHVSREALAAAEERGRRRGVEGLADARALLIELRHELLRVDGGPAESIAELPASLRRASTVTRASAAIRALNAALAPREPHASEGPPCAGCGHPKWQHQYGSKEHAFCSQPVDGLQLAYCSCKNYLAPRDSAPDPDPTCPEDFEPPWPRDSGKEG